MSKAFTRESDDVPEQPLRPRLLSSLPPGTKNYLTSDGARRFQAELERLTREWQAHAEPGATPPLRIQQLVELLAGAEIVPPPPGPWERVRFGARVEVRLNDGNPASYRIVGVDEVDADRDWVSWRSPIGRALLNACLGQRVRVKLPAGEQEWEILAIRYDAPFV